MTYDTLLPFDLPSVHRKKLTVDFAGGNQSSDAGLLLLRQAERKFGVCGRLAAAMPDRRDRTGGGLSNRSQCVRTESQAAKFGYRKIAARD